MFAIGLVREVLDASYQDKAVNVLGLIGSPQVPGREACRWRLKQTGRNSVLVIDNTSR